MKAEITQVMGQPWPGCDLRILYVSSNPLVGSYGSRFAGNRAGVCSFLKEMETSQCNSPHEYNVP